MEHQSEHDIAHLERRIRELSGHLTDMADDTDMQELLRIIHGPGWTTPAEYLLVNAIVDAMHEHTKTLVGLKQALINGSRAVELNPQPLPPG